jgi:small subunit ribosomal protein S16
VARFLGRAGLIAMPAIPAQTKQAQPKKKAQERAAAAAG